MASLYEQYLGNNRDYLYNTLGKASDQAGQDAIDAKKKAMGYQDLGDASYMDLLNGQGGYTPGERDTIIGADRLDQMQLTPDQQDAAYLSTGEQQGIAGDPNNRGTYFHPGDDLSATYGEQNRARGIANSGVQGSVGFATQAKQIADPSKLVQSQDFVDRYRMTPEQVQAAATSAARDSTAVDQAAMERAREAGTAAGMDPLGMASYLNRANRSSQQDAARSAAAARVAAQNQQAQRELAIETNRQGAQGVATGTQLGALNSGYDAIRDATTQQLKDEELGNSAAQQQRQFNTNTGTQIAGAQEDQRTGAAKTIATNRQGVNLQNRNDVYDRSKYADTQLAGRTAGVADTRLAEQQKARDYVTGQVSGEQGQQQQDANRQIAGYGATAGGVQANLGLQYQNDNKPKWYDKLLSAGAQVAAGAASNPALV